MFKFNWFQNEKDFYLLEFKVIIRFIRGSECNKRKVKMAHLESKSGLERFWWAWE